MGKTFIEADPKAVGGPIGEPKKEIGFKDGEVVINADDKANSTNGAVKIFALSAEKQYIMCEDPANELLSLLRTHIGNICLVILPGLSLASIGQETLDYIRSQNIPSMILTGAPEDVDKALAEEIPIVSKIGSGWGDVLRDAFGLD